MKSQTLLLAVLALFLLAGFAAAAPKSKICSPKEGWIKIRPKILKQNRAEIRADAMTKADVAIAAKLGASFNSTNCPMTKLNIYKACMKTDIMSTTLEYGAHALYKCNKTTTFKVTVKGDVTATTMIG